MPDRTALKSLLSKATEHYSASRYGQALEACDQALALAPGHIPALCSRATALNRLNRPNEARAILERVIEQRPQLAGPHYALGSLLLERGQAAGALPHLEKALSLAPQMPDVHTKRALALLNLGLAGEALAAADVAAEVWPEESRVGNLRGSALIALRRFDEAISALQEVVAKTPDYAEAHLNLGVAFREGGRPADAIACFDRALALKPEMHQARVNRGVALLALGRFETGWRDYERRGRYAIQSQRLGITQPLWLGETDIAGRTILVSAELGLGDTLQFSRYLPILERAGARVLFAPQPPLAALMTGVSPTVSIVDPDPRGLEFDCHCRLMSLPLAFGTTLDTIPADVPYLAPDATRAARWRDVIGLQGFRIGVCWRGSNARQGRAFQIEDLAGIGAIPNVRLISLQTGEAAQDPLPEGMHLETLGPQFDAGPDALLDAAAVIEACDLVITTDTSIGHLAGALNRPTWIPINRDACWRWLVEREDSPWYPNHRLFRLASQDDWAGAFARMETELRTRTQ